MTSTVTPPPKPRRHYGRWIALGLVVMLTPLIVLGVGILSMIRLDRDAAALKREVMAATDAGWHTKVQVSLGWVTLSALRTGLSFVQREHMDEARLALRAVRAASVGVYERSSVRGGLSLARLFDQTDQTMRDRGWTRLVGVSENNKTVLIYATEVIASDRCVDLCVAVLDGRELVVVSTRVDGSALVELAALHLPKDGLRGKLKIAKLGI